MTAELPDESNNQNFAHNHAASEELAGKLMAYCTSFPSVLLIVRLKL